MLRQVTREVGIELLGTLGYEAHDGVELERALLLTFLILSSLRASLVSLSGSHGDQS